MGQATGVPLLRGFRKCKLGWLAALSIVEASAPTRPNEKHAHLHQWRSHDSSSQQHWPFRWSNDTNLLHHRLKSVRATSTRGADTTDASPLRPVVDSPAALSLLDEEMLANSSQTMPFGERRPKGNFLCVVSGNSKRGHHVSTNVQPKLTEVNSSLYLFSLLLPVDSLMLRHWLRHYHGLGVRPNHTFIAIRLDPGRLQDAALNATLSTLRAAGVPIANVRTLHSPPSDDLKKNEMNAMMRSLPKDSWFIYADVDELFDYPCNINKMNLEKFKCIYGVMWDQAAANGNISEAQESSSLMEQFPFQCRLRSHLTPRLMIAKTIIVTTGGSRFVKRSFRSTHATDSGCTQLGIVRHYSLTGQQLANNAERKSIQPQASLPSEFVQRKPVFGTSVNYANATCGMTDPKTGACKDYSLLHDYMVTQVEQVAAHGSAAWVHNGRICPRNLEHDRFNMSSWEELKEMFRQIRERAAKEKAAKVQPLPKATSATARRTHGSSPTVSTGVRRGHNSSRTV